MEYETYGDVIDAYNSGVGVETGESLTDYIKRNNIRIKEIEMDPIGDFEKILREGKRPMEKEGIMQMASRKNMDVRIEEIVKEFVKQKGRRPRSLEEIKEFFMNEMGTASDPAATNMNNVRLARYEPGKYSDDEIEMYEQYKYDMNEQRPGMPIMEIDEFLRMEKGSARVGVAAGGLPAILGV
tara:strand:+ start:217 stop:765 length:549 start_codon:yes stop_codon:yes gene_type:complete